MGWRVRRQGCIKIGFTGRVNASVRWWVCALGTRHRGTALFDADIWLPAISVPWLPT